MTAGADEYVSLPLVRRSRRRAGSAADANELGVQVEELVRQCEHRLGKYLAQMVRDRSLAENLHQDTFHVALSSPDQLARVANAEAWLFGIARNRALNALRKGRRFHAAVARLARLPPAADEQDHELVALRDLLERHLSPDDRALLILRYLHGFDAAELGEMTGRSAEAVRQRLGRVRAKLIAAADAARHDSTEEV